MRDRGVGMRLVVGVAFAIGSVLLSASCVAESERDARSTASSEQDDSQPTSPREDLTALAKGPPAEVAWSRGATVWPAGGVAPVRLDLPNPWRVNSIVAYRGGYLASVFLRPATSSAGVGVVFDSQGRRVRRLDGCVAGPVSSLEGSLVAWTSYACRGEDETSLWVGPRDDLEAPDQTQLLPTLDRMLGYPSAVGEWGVAIQRTDGIRGYPEGVFVARPATGEVTRVPGVNEVTSVSPQGIACCVSPSSTLVDLATHAPVGRLAMQVVAWSPDGTQALVPMGGRGHRWKVVNPFTGTVLRRFSLPARLDVGEARWEDARDLLFNVGRYASVADVYFSTIVRVTPSGEVQRATGVTRGEDPQFL